MVCVCGVCGERGVESAELEEGGEVREEKQRGGDWGEGVIGLDWIGLVAR